MKIIAVDPGLYSGYAFWNSADPRFLQRKEIPYQDTADRVWAEMEEWDEKPEIVVERYTMTPGIKSAQPHALMTMGQLEFIARRFATRLHYYLPSTNKKTVSDQRLRSAGWYLKTKDGHANDAARLVGTHLAQHLPEVFGKLFGI
jgi:hypothetical protein